MEYFVERRFTFLCIKVTPEEGKKEVAPSEPHAPGPHPT
jgi:hypothetical protein